MITETILSNKTSEAKNQTERMNGYYRFHAKIYDLSRWTFLFGRRRIIDNLPFPENAAILILEVGCGTEKNLAYIGHRFPKAKMIGVDISREMLAQARKKMQPISSRVQLIEGTYGEKDLSFVEKPDVILFSYCLTMVNPDFEKLIEQANYDLKPDGIIAVVDFHDSRFESFKRWMSINHVRMESHLLPILKNNFSELRTEILSAYTGAWKYLIIYGKKMNDIK